MMKRHLAALATAAALVTLAPAASAQSLEWDPTSSQMPFADTFSSEEPLKSVGQGIFTVAGSVFWTPLILSSMIPSLFGPQCNLFDTRACFAA